MNFWQLLTYAAWGISALLMVWILVDAFNISKQYDDEFLMSAREGADELMDH
jgi:hypothetical protein